MKKLEKFLNTAVEQYENGLPLHLTNPNRSAFATMSESEFLNKSSRDKQELIQHKHILITDCAFQQLKFDEDGLRILCPPWKTIEIQGEIQLITATSDQLLKASEMDSGKILNALEFPMNLASLSPMPKFSTDLLAWACTATEFPPPIGDIQFGLAATPGARTWFHIDCMGFLTFVETMCGFKIWMCIRDQDGQFVVVDMFKDFELDDAHGYYIEAILLTPGTRL